MTSQFKQRIRFCSFPYQAMDRNKDGYITKGELKLAKKSVGMAEIDQVRTKDHRYLLTQRNLTKFFVSPYLCLQRPVATLVKFL